MHVLHAIRFPGDPDFDDVPEGLEWDEKDTDMQPSSFAGGQKDDRESKFEHVNGMTNVITNREWEQELTTRGYPLAWSHMDKSGHGWPAPDGRALQVRPRFFRPHRTVR